MLNFTKFERVNPEKRDVLQRLKDYKEVYQVFTKHRAIEQADRCMQCGDPYCHTGCPLGNYIVNDVEMVLRSLEGVKDVHVELTYDPPWSPEMMSDDAKKELGYL